MEKISIQEKLSKISSYSQVNKAFRHAYGAPAAAVLATLLYKYDYWDEENKLEKVTTKKGSILYCFYISRVDLAFDAGVSFSLLEKMIENNPLVLLESLGYIKRLSSEGVNKSDKYVLYPNKIIYDIKELEVKYKEDRELMKYLSASDKIKFYKALKGKATRDEIYSKFKKSDINAVLEIEDLESDEIKNPSFEEFIGWDEGFYDTDKGITNKESKIISKNKLKTNPEEPSLNDEKKSAEDFNTFDFDGKYKNKEITRELVGNGIMDYNRRLIEIEQMYYILKNYIPAKKGMSWKMSDKDESYIRHNIGEVSNEELDYVLDEIDKNINDMLDEKLDMRFGSILAKIHERVRMAGVARK